MEAGNLIIGSGPAGLAAAAFAPDGAMVFEGRKAPGWKILISGGGHCNVTNTFPAEDYVRFLGRAGRPLKHALYSFGPEAIRSFLAAHGCPTVVRNGWEVYPKSNRASDILDTLLAAAKANGAEVVCGARVTDIRRRAGRFVVTTRGEEVPARRVLVATGSPAWDRPRPEFDAVVERLGHTIRPWVAAISPVVLRDNPFEGLQGIAFRGRVAVAGRWRDADEILVTDEGLSGPAAMNASAEIHRRLRDGAGDEFEVDLLPGETRDETVRAILSARARHPRGTLVTVLAESLPRRLAERLLALAGAGEVTLSQAKREDAEKVSGVLHNFRCAAAGLPPVAKGFVASGGVPLEEVNPRTLESRIVPGLFFAGEILDYDAPSGGFYITIALATGRLAGLGLHGRAD